MPKFEELAEACSPSFSERFCSFNFLIYRLVLVEMMLPVALLSIWHSAWSDSQKACLTMPKFEELAWACSSMFFERFRSIKFADRLPGIAYDCAANGIAVDVALCMERLAKSMLNHAEI